MYGSSEMFSPLVNVCFLICTHPLTFLSLRIIHTQSTIHARIEKIEYNICTVELFALKYVLLLFDMHSITVDFIRITVYN